MSDHTGIVPYSAHFVDGIVRFGNAVKMSHGHSSYLHQLQLDGVIIGEGVAL